MIAVTECCPAGFPWTIRNDIDINMGVDFVSNSIRVILAGDNPEKLAQIRSSLQNDPGVIIVGEAANAEEAVELVNQSHPDLLILSITKPDEPGSEWQNLQQSLFGVVRMVLYT